MTIKELRIHKILLMIVINSFVPVVTAEQVIDVIPGHTYKVSVSANQMNSISMKQIHIVSASATEGDVVLKEDSKSGVITFNVSSARPFPVFIRDEDGDTYNLQMMPDSKISAQIITLVPKQKIQRQNSQFMKSQPWKTQLKRLAKAIANNTAEEKGYIVQKSQKKKEKEIPLWKEARFVFLKKYLAAKIEADVYQLTNTSKDEMVVDEREFSEIGKQVLSVGFLENSPKVTQQADRRIQPSHSILVVIFRVRSL